MRRHVWTANNPVVASHSDLNSFPEIAQMEREFQQNISIAEKSKQYMESTGNLSNRGHQGADRANAKTADVKALVWAQNNPWFGSDMAMTTYAYAMHDEIMADGKLDCQSDEYYDEIDRRISERFPEKLESPNPALKHPGQ